MACFIRGNGSLTQASIMQCCMSSMHDWWLGRLNKNYLILYWRISVSASWSRSEGGSARILFRRF
jgi:hypothetical protein